jgi:hypothetical protein
MAPQVAHSNFSLVVQTWVGAVMQHEAAVIACTYVGVGLGGGVGLEGGAGQGGSGDAEGPPPEGVQGAAGDVLASALVGHTVVVPLQEPQ